MKKKSSSSIPQAKANLNIGTHCDSQQTLLYPTVKEETKIQSSTPASIISNIQGKAYDEKEESNVLNFKKKTYFRQYTSSSAQPSADYLFKERFNKVTFRDFTHNTRLNINNNNYQDQKVKRDRQISYWKNNVINLPPISNKNKVSASPEQKRQQYLQYKYNSSNHLKSKSTSMIPQIYSSIE